MSNIMKDLGTRAAHLLGDKDDGLAGVIIAIFNLDGDHGSSITTIVEKTRSTNNVYIEESLIQEKDVMVPLMSVLCQMQIGYLFTALGIYQSVDRYKTIRETVNRVIADSYDIPLDAAELICDTVFAKGPQPIMDAMRDAKYKIDVDESAKHLISGRLMEFDFHVDSSMHGTTTVDEDDDDDEVDDIIRVQSKDAGTVTVPIYVQLIPIPMPTEVTTALIELNYPQRFWRRLEQARAREIRGLRDFIFAFDLIEKHRKALRRDKYGVLNRFYRSKIDKQYSRISAVITGKKRNNIANAIIIMTEPTFESAMDNTSIDLRNARDRQHFFNEAYAMMLVIVDIDNNEITLYINGISAGSTWPISAFKRAGSDSSGIDIGEFMETVAKGGSVKF